MSLVEDAAAELYGGDLDAFTDRRRDLAAAARQQGDAAAAKEIAALRKPTRSAWMLNALAGAAADQLGQLDDLAAELRDAEERLDGAAMRELSKRRRDLVGDLARRAFKATGQSEPSTQWDGFGSGSAPTTRPNLRAVPSPKADPTPREPTTIERAKRERVAAAEKEVTAARRVVVKAETEAAKHQQRLDDLEEQLAAARRQLTETGHQVRDAKAELRRAEQKLDRARG